MLEGFKGEPEEDDGVEEAVQTMGPVDLQKKKGERESVGRQIKLPTPPARRGLLDTDC